MVADGESLKAIFEPSSVAVIGASKQPGKVGHDIFVNILKGGFTGALYPVNPRAKSINSVKCYPSITDIEDPIDLAMIILAPNAALKAVEASITKGVQGIIIVSAGFREVGAEGRAIEGTSTKTKTNVCLPLVCLVLSKSPSSSSPHNDLYLSCRQNCGHVPRGQCPPGRSQLLGCH